MNDRQKEIVELVERRGYMSIEGLAAHFNLTPQTMRRDINQLCDRGMLARQHGGASLPPSLSNTSYNLRHIERVSEKARIAEAVAAFLPERATLFMALGTTVEAVAEALARTNKTLTIVTNNTEVARTCWTRTNFETFLTGGVLQHRNGGLVGRRAIEMAMNFRCDYFISGIGAIEPDGALLDFYEAELAVMEVMRANARHHLVVADHSKFHRKANQKLCSLADLFVLFTDREPPEQVALLARQGDVRIVVADRSTPSADVGQDSWPPGEAEPPSLSRDASPGLLTR
jgi:DeoR family transcriptional regulator, glycerol-3-phosphate regulon repressor